jgi:peptidyl-prolyl cis-trans isomerase A (cyclophilin A)
MNQTRALRSRLIVTAVLLIAAAPAAFAVDVRLCTPQGVVDVELDERRAPQHARNFVRYAESGYYSGTVIHRSVPDTMVQGGSFDMTLERRRPGAPVADESGNGLSNRRGTIAASRGADPDSATSQFYFNLTDNTHLDATPESPGFTVFGRVTAGLDVLDTISRLPTQQLGELSEVPVPLVELESVSVLERESRFGLTVEPDPASLGDELQTAMQSRDSAATLAAATKLRQACLTLTGAQRLAEAEAAIAEGQVDRARYGLAQYLARASQLDPLLPRAQRLYAGLPPPTVSDIERRLAQCIRPAAPSIPDGRFSELATLQAIESEVRRYRQMGESYLSCVASEIDSGSLNELETIDATEKYNELVIELTATATRFNEAVSSFKAEQ